ncbi:MAG: PQQ-dependent sugar dehydrogenase, partial [Acidimicrobiia bacterium]
VGQNRFEEIDWVPPARQSAANYGWRKYEGDALFAQNDNIDESKLVRPILTYELGSGNCAVTGGYVYRGEVNTLRGFYLYADVCNGDVKAFRQKDGAAIQERDLQFHVDEMVSFGEDADGQLYLVSLGGKVFKIVRKS